MFLHRFLQGLPDQLHIHLCSSQLPLQLNVLLAEALSLLCELCSEEGVLPLQLLQAQTAPQSGGYKLSLSCPRAVSSSSPSTPQHTLKQHLAVLHYQHSFNPSKEISGGTEVMLTPHKG